MPTSKHHRIDLCILNRGQQFYFEDCDDGIHFTPVYGIVEGHDDESHEDVVTLFVSSFYGDPPRRGVVNMSELNLLDPVEFDLARKLDWPPIDDVRRRLGMAVYSWAGSTRTPACGRCRGSSRPMASPIASATAGSILTSSSRSGSAVSSAPSPPLPPTTVQPSTPARRCAA